MGAAAGVFCTGYLSSRIGSRVVCTAVFLLCGLGRAAEATLASLETAGAWADTRTPNRLRAVLTMLLGAVSESQWVMMNVLVQTALLGHPERRRASGNAAYRLTNAVGSVLTPLAVTQVTSVLPSCPLRPPCTSRLHPPSRLVSTGTVSTHSRARREGVGGYDDDVAADDVQSALRCCSASVGTRWCSWLLTLRGVARPSVR